VTGRVAGEPGLAEVQTEYPGWQCSHGNSGLYHAKHPDTGTRVDGEDPVDLRDQIKGAEARLACQPGPAGTL
jgi:hypothetical protein